MVAVLSIRTHEEIVAARRSAIDRSREEAAESSRKTARHCAAVVLWVGMSAAWSSFGYFSITAAWPAALGCAAAAIVFGWLGGRAKG